MRGVRFALLAAAILAVLLPGAAARATGFIVNTTSDQGDAQIGDGICVTPAVGTCTLRAAIEEANARAGHDVITFSIASGAQTISPVGALPAITDPVTIDGSTQPGYSGRPLIQLDGSLIPVLSTSNGLTIVAGGSLVRGLSITRFDEAGIGISGGEGNRLQGNFLGIDTSGSVPLPNRIGVHVLGSSDNVIGGTDPGAGNLISGNSLFGIELRKADRTLVQGNLIGTDASGTIDLGNVHDGIRVTFGEGNTIGGRSASARNLISGNGGGTGPSGGVVYGAGIELRGGAAVIEGNYIGTDITGRLPMGNTEGISVSSAQHVIGGTAPGSGNLISGNQFAGVAFIGGRNRLQGNLIGTDVTGTQALPNGWGVSVQHATDLLIGGGTPGAGNAISGNKSAGVVVHRTDPASQRVTIAGNSIWGNGGLGISLGRLTPTPNDSRDADSGPNGLQNSPSIEAANSGSTFVVHGRLHSTPATTFTIEIFSNASCDPSGSGEGELSAGTTTVTTDAAGDGRFKAVFGKAPRAGDVVTATATDPQGNTSEFSECRSAP